MQNAALQRPPLQLDRAVTIIIIAYLPISYLHFSIGIFPFPLTLSLLFVEKLYQCCRLVQKSVYSLVAHYITIQCCRC